MIAHGGGTVAEWLAFGGYLHSRRWSCREPRSPVPMPVRRDFKTEAWFFWTTVKTIDGKKLRLYGTLGALGRTRSSPLGEVVVEARRPIRATSSAAAMAGHGELCARRRRRAWYRSAGRSR